MLQKPVAFAVTFLALFALVFAFLWATDTLPNATTGEAPQQAVEVQQAPEQTAAQSPEAPVRVVAKDIGLDVAVVNPATTSVDVLDHALESGAVRYPTSALLGQDGTVLLFGHSSYLPIVYHQYYKTFNGIQNLKQGATVSVYSGGMEYRYAVSGVRLANATEDVIQLPQDGKHLILVTCDSFATKSTRYVVNADFVGAYSLQ